MSIHNPAGDRRRLGAEGESRAADHLQRRGYRIVERNVRLGGVEVDLVARKGRVVALVEVKTRRSSRYGPPELAVDHRKQQRLIRAAQAWIQTHPSQCARIRFDVIACRVTGAGASERWQITHVESAFDASA